MLWIRNWGIDWRDLVLTFALWRVGAQHAVLLQWIRRAPPVARNRAEVTFLYS